MNILMNIIKYIFIKWYILFVDVYPHINIALCFSSEVIAVTLIPLGTSGPEIFSSVVSVLFTDNDIGTGAIIGSACFNQLAIPAVCGFAVVYFVGKPIQLDDGHIFMDLFVYMVSVIGMIFTIKDQQVDLYVNIVIINTLI